MNTNQNSNNLVESALSSSSATAKPLYKYTVICLNGDVDTLQTNHWGNVLNHLMDDDTVMNLGYADYMEHLDGRYSDENLNEWIEMYIKDFAEQSGYKIQESK